MNRLLYYFRCKANYYWRILTKPEVIQNNGIKIKMGPHVSSQMMKSIYTGAYEKSELTILANVLEKNDRIMDLGAGLAFLTIYCAKQIGSENIFAYEANPELIEHIAENFKLNDVHPHVENTILSNNYGEEVFFIDKSIWSSSTIKRNTAIKSVLVGTKDINDEIIKNDINFLIIDIEGGEKDLIKKIKFQNTPISKILIEMHPHVIGDYQASQILYNIIKFGFTLSLLKSKGIVLYFERKHELLD